ncbi:threonine synthase [Bacillus salitolerans]|uniref:Threonine synthase n=1 Tax=Bacillus salitolerans TaxID=1437434 RepID=A0ABW4LRH6_9BACI
MSLWRGLIKEYEAFLPVTEQTPSLTLCEGNTPLLHLQNLSAMLNINFFVKWEGVNPTGSFKDRGMVLAVAKAMEHGSKMIMCASTGNTSASAAAYAARAGLRCIIVIPQGKIAAGKLAQAFMYGAEIIQIDGNFDDALAIVQQVCNAEEITLVNSVNPYRIEGQKTASFEICDQLSKAPDILAIPVGNAGNITAYWKGFKEYHEHYGTYLPKMYGYQASGAAPLVRNQKVDVPETIATAIRIGNPASWNGAVEAVSQSGGAFEEVTDQEITEAYQLIARKEGIFAEPGSCASIAGIIKDSKRDKIKAGTTVVAVLTGNGLKDPAYAMEIQDLSPVTLSNNREEIQRYLKGVVSHV